MRARTFWIALPIAVVFALWAGPGLATEDEMPSAPAPEPVDVPTEAPVVDGDEELAPTDPLAPTREIECETPVDPGPDGDL